MRWFVMGGLLVVVGCASGPRLVVAEGTKRSASEPVERLQHQSCLGEKGAANLVVVKDGKCLCYDPPWDAGVRPPDEREREARSDFDGVFLCRYGVGAVESRAVDARFCPMSMPAAGSECSMHDAMLRNGDCLYVEADMRTLAHARCEAGAWREVPVADLQRERANRP